MANETTKDVKLRIRAEDYSQKTLDNLVSTLEDLIAAQEKQQAAAKKGETTSKELEASYRKLESAAKALISQDALIKTYHAQADALEKSKQRTDDARVAQEQFVKSAGDAANLTNKQVTALNKLNRAVATAEATQQNSDDRLARTVAKMNQYGVAVDQVVGAQNRIAAAVSTANQALERQDDALDKIEANIRNAAAAAAEKAAADREAAAAVAASLAAAEKLSRAKDEAADQAVREAKAQGEVRHALNLAADEALALAKGYQTLSRSLDQIRSGGVSESLRRIADPAGEALRSITGLETAVDELSISVKAIDGPITAYRDKMAQINAIQKSMGNLGGLIDAFRKQEDSVERARIEYEAAERAVTELAAKMKLASGTANDFNQKMSSAQSRLKAAAVDMQSQSQAAQNLREKLHAAGIETANLAAAEDKLITNANKAKTAVNQLTVAYNQYGVAVDKADKNSLRMWLDNGRTTLSYMQRVRGEVLALGSAYIGIQGAINLAKGSLEAYRSSQAIESRLSIVVGDDAKAIQKEWDYLMGQADRLGFGFQTLALDYTKFAVAAKANNMSLQETRYIFENMAEAARGARLSTDDFSGVMRATEQMLNKGKITAEELTQQLGDRLPGAFALAAKGAEMTTAEFTKAMEQGQISSEYVLNLAREAGETYKVAFEKTADSMAAAEGRLQTATFKFQKAIADGGFTDAYTDFIEKLAALMSSSEGEKLAGLLSDAFTGLIDVLQWCAENTDLVKAAFSAFIGLQVGKTIASWVPAVTELAGGIKLLFKGISALKTGGVGQLLTSFGGIAAAGAAGTKAATGFARALQLLGVAARFALRFVPVLGWAITAWSIYDLLAGKEDEAEKAGKELGQAAAAGFAEGTEDPGTGGTSGERVAKALMKTLATERVKSEKLELSARKKTAKEDLDERLQIAGEPFDAMRKQAEQFITDEKRRAEVLVEIEAGKNARLIAETKKYHSEQGKGEEESAARRARIAGDVAAELERIQDELVNREVAGDPASSFEDRMAARVQKVSHEYDKLLKKIAQLARFDPSGAANARATTEEYIKWRQELEKIKVTQEELTRLEKGLNQETSARTAQLQALQAQYEAGLLTQDEYRNRVQETNSVTSAGIQQSGAELQEFARKYQNLMRPEDFQELMARTTAIMANATDVMVVGEQELAFAQEDLNRNLSERQNIIDVINAKLKAGLITEREAADAITATNGRYKDSIDAAAEAVIAMATALRNPANAQAMDELIAKMQVLKIETKATEQAFTELDSVIVNSIVNNGVEALDQMAQAMAGVISGQMTMRDMWAEIGRASAMFFAELLRDIAKAIIRQQILNMLKNSGNPYLAAAAGAMGATQNHSGGTVGMGSGNHTRRVDSSIFANAPKFHSGGLPGIKPSEVPAILEEGEEVLSRDDPRNILNGGASAGGGGGSTKFVLVDDRASMAEAMAGSEGEAVTMLNLRKNIPTLKQWLR